MSFTKSFDDLVKSPPASLDTALDSFVDLINDGVAEGFGIVMKDAKDFQEKCTNFRMKNENIVNAEPAEGLTNFHVSFALLNCHSLPMLSEFIYFLYSQYVGPPASNMDDPGFCAQLGQLAKSIAKHYSTAVKNLQGQPQTKAHTLQTLKNQEARFEAYKNELNELILKNSTLNLFDVTARVNIIKMLINHAQYVKRCILKNSQTWKTYESIYALLNTLGINRGSLCHTPSVEMTSVNRSIIETNVQDLEINMKVVDPHSITSDAATAKNISARFAVYEKAQLDSSTAAETRRHNEVDGLLGEAMALIPKITSIEERFRESYDRKLRAYLVASAARIVELSDKVNNLSTSVAVLSDYIRKNNPNVIPKELDEHLTKV